ncbi:hypothetical protein, partial [Escherichia coli]|uniref:hypothetical protein n=4 Tax=Escherichia coli TaxID=562 RepID=UPI0019D37AD2
KRSSAIHTLRRITGTTLAVTFSTFTEHNGASLSDAFALWNYQSGRYSFILNYTSLSRLMFILFGCEINIKLIYML